MDINDRIELLKAVAVGHDTVDMVAFSTHLHATGGNMEGALAAWEKTEDENALALSSAANAASPPSKQHAASPFGTLRLLNSLIDVTDSNVNLVMAIRTEKPEAKTLRDVVLGLGKGDLERLARSEGERGDPSVVQRAAVATSDPLHIATMVRRNLFKAEPTGVIQRMMMDEEIPISPTTKAHVHAILDENPSFDIRRTPVSAVLSTSAAFQTLSSDARPVVESDFKTLQRVQALAPVPEAIPTLLDQKLTTALHISNIPEDSFVQAFSSSFGDPAIATSVHLHATASRVRNENFLVSALQTVRGSGLRVIDGGAGKDTVERRVSAFQQTALQVKTQVNLERLFGTLDYCECSECNSVYSPASYFVELLEFLRHTNLKSSNTHLGATTFKGTQLEQLLLRRPDLQCIQLTCENTNTLIPYIDLALEVMESYVVHAPLITAYNVNGETSAELLAQPQHTNQEAYAILRDAVYPLKLPYNFAIDTMRVFLSFLKTSRAELLRIFQPHFTQGPAADPVPAQQTAQRAADAEFNLITQEEYVILTHQSFSPPSVSPSCHQPCTCANCTSQSSRYASKIHLGQPWEYFGYKAEAGMLDDGDNPKAGLTWVKAQFLPRTGSTYEDLVTLLKTAYINPSMPRGKALATMQKLRFSYRFLSYLVRNHHHGRHQRFALLIRFLSFAQPLIPLIEWAKAKTDPCAEISGNGAPDCGCRGALQAQEHDCSCCCDSEQEWRAWVYAWFEKVGKIIVLESGEGPRLPFEGRMWALPSERPVATPGAQMISTAPPPQKPPPWKFVGALQGDGAIVRNNEAVGFVTIAGRVIDVLTGEDLSKSFDDSELTVYDSDPVKGGELPRRLGYVGGRDNVLMYYDPLNDGIQTPARYSPTQDTCDIEKVRLMHLDGSKVQPDEYERMLRILRLSQKMGWSIGETDEAIAGLGKPKPAINGHSSSSPSKPGRTLPENNDEGGEGEEEEGSAGDITVDLIHQLVAVKKLLDITGFALSALLTCWTDMPTHGDKSIYAKTFLTHNLIRMDPVFQADGDGNFLTADERITDHLPILMAALRLRAEEIILIQSVRKLPDKITLSTVSELFRFSKILKFIAVRIEYLPDILAVFGEPFTDADSTLEFLETWQKMTDSGFTFPQLNYMIRTVDNISHPLAPSIPQILRLAKTIYDGLVDIDRQHPNIVQADIDNNVVSLAEVIPAQLALIYDSTLASKINDLIGGKYAFTTNAPSGLILSGTPPAKVKYIDQKNAKPPKAQLAVTGILTEDEVAATIGLTADQRWAAAVQRIGKQGITFYNQTLASLLPADGAAVMLKGDTTNTPTEKGLYFMKSFIPFLRAQLATQLVQTSVSDVTGLDPKLASYLLTVVRSSPQKTALQELLALKEVGATNPAGWHGFLIPPSTGNFTFTITSDTQPAPVIMNGRPLPFPHQSEDPSNIWSSNPVIIVVGTLYEVQLAGLAPEQLSWSTTASPAVAIPTSALLPTLSSDAVRNVLEKLAKVSLLVKGFNLSLDEVVFFHNHGSDFASRKDGKPLEIDALSLGTWKRLQTYVALRDTLPKQPTRLIDLFSWASLPDSTNVVEEIRKVTLWDSDKVQGILARYDALEPSDFKNELVLVKLQTALGFVTKTQIDILLLFQWAKPLSLSDASYKKLGDQAESLKHAVRARYNADDWEQAVRPLFNILRKNQRDALVAYLVVEESLVATGLVKDADGLFEYFLIDCQMSACLETSRIKQAIATIQLYVQRCLLGLEQEVGKKEEDLISRERWDWMKRYRVWEANRKVYLYPENWIVPSLRDDKTPLFLDFESQLQQKDISMRNVAESLKEYIYNVAYVSNMKVYGLFVVKDQSNANKSSVNLVSRRMNAPFDWYSRDYSSAGFWSPWVKMPIDIPNYDVDDEDGNSHGSGAYVCPVMWHGQPVIFFLQMVQKQISQKDDHTKTMWQKLSSEEPDKGKPRPMWEIRLGYSLFQNGKWSQKQLSHDSLRHKAKLIQIWDPKTTGEEDHSKWKKLDTYPLPNQTRYQMYPRTIGHSELRIDVVYRDDLYNAVGGETDPATTKVGYFFFTNGAVASKVDDQGGSTVDTSTSFHYKWSDSMVEIHSFQVDDPGTAPPLFGQLPKVQYQGNPTANSKSKVILTDTNSFVFNHTFVDALLEHINTDNTSNSLNHLYAQFASMSEAAMAAGDDPFGLIPKNSFNERLSPYAIYNWELGLHVPMTAIDGLLNAQQFDDALAVCHKIFDPSAVGAASDPSGDNSKYWKFYPFKALANTDAKETLEKMFLHLDPQAPDHDIDEWRDNPFSPHSIARNRPIAYMKWIVMKYIEILIAYGDYYFRQNSLETIPNAIQCYVIASHVYGPRGQKIPKRGKIKPETYASLLNRWDAFGNAVVQLEVEFPFSNQTSLPIGSSNGISGFANIFGFATSLYFCIPNNPKLIELRDMIDDRLYKIRNCMDINGVVRHLALWDPPIDPALLVQATAQGLSLDTVLNDLSGPIPNYRFLFLLQKAFEMCSELKSLAAGLLAAKEKKDSEALTVLRASHETIINDLTLDIRNRQLDEANSALEQLLHSREGPSYRLQFYKFLVGLTDGPPGETDDFNEIPNRLQVPSPEGELLLIPPEQEEVQKALAAQNWAIGVGSVEALAAIFHAIPSTEAAAKPWGVGAGLVWGGMNLGHTTSAVARGLQVYETYLTHSSSNAGRKAALMRQLQDRIFQANSIGLELKNIDKQIVTQRVRVSTTEKEVKNQQKVLDQVSAVEEFLRTKHTNEELYTWIEGTTKSLYQQSYNLAFDLAKRAEKAFNFERPQNSTEFIRMGYWTNARDGLLAGEQLYLGLKRLEAAYQENLGHDFELTKHVSIRQWAPLALVDFRETGSFELSLPEVLFDMDCPGHYMRRIVSVAVTIPCVVGPYTNVNCTLRLLSHTIRTTPRASGKADYPRSTDGDDDRFSTLNVPISSIALSSAQTDTGRHELSLTDRYNPFEGAGAISRWRFDLPPDFRAFDYGSVSDVLMHIRYTALDGGDKLRQIAASAVTDFVKTVEDSSKEFGLVTFFDLRADFASEWYTAFRPGNPTAVRELKMEGLADMLPIFTRMTKPKRIVAFSMVLLGRGSLAPDEVTMALLPDDGGRSAAFKPGADVGGLVGLSSEGIQMPMTSWALRVSGKSVNVERLWLVVRYALT